MLNFYLVAKVVKNQKTSKNKKQLKSTELSGLLKKIKIYMTETQIRNLLHYPSYREIYPEKNHLIILHIIVNKQQILCLQFQREEEDMPFVLVKKNLISMQYIAKIFK